MRTTIDVEERLLERAKRFALKENQTLGAVVGEALTVYLASRKSTALKSPFTLLVRGQPHGRFPTKAALIEAEDEDDRRAVGVPEFKRCAAP